MGTSPTLNCPPKLTIKNQALIVDLLQFAPRVILIPTKKGKVFNNYPTSRTYPKKILADRDYLHEALADQSYRSSICSQFYKNNLSL